MFDGWCFRMDVLEEILKQVRDLSDQDNDSMLSLREFCIVLYLMEQYKEGENLPPTLFSNGRISVSDILGSELMISSKADELASRKQLGCGYGIPGIFACLKVHDRLSKLVFEGAFEEIFSIIKEERGVVVQVLLRETIGFDLLISILKLRGTTYSFTQQKTINLLSAFETISLLLNGGLETDPSSKNKCSGPSTNARRRKSMGPVAVRCAIR
ncbi:golgin candidate 6 isoform X1 [Tanacetum coccineum]